MRASDIITPLTRVAFVYNTSKQRNRLVTYTIAIILATLNRFYVLWHHRNHQSHYYYYYTSSVITREEPALLSRIRDSVEGLLHPGGGVLTPKNILLCMLSYRSLLFSAIGCQRD